jgi:deoxyribose-phosphate aldolase
MDKADVADRIEHTVLGPTTAWPDVAEVLDAALQYGMRACVPPAYIERACEYAPTVDVTTVVGFPHGQHATQTKCQEAEFAWNAGAAELDVVCNLGSLRTDPDAFAQELDEIIAGIPVPVKVIVEAHLLDEAPLRRACELAAEADAAFVKTSTGFSDGGATVEDVTVMSEYLPVKASGGIGSWAFTKELFDAGADRIGASSGTTILREYRDTS